MSSDNGTYILCTEGPEFRIAHAQAIDNIYGTYCEETCSYLPNPEMFVSYFGDCEVYDDLEKAWDKASHIDYEAGYSEYGINLITEFSNYNFKDLREKAKGKTSER